MKPTTSLKTLVHRLGILCIILSLCGCGDGDTTDQEPPAKSANLSFKIGIAPPPENTSQTRSFFKDVGIGEKNICVDHGIDTITVTVYESSELIDTQKIKCSDREFSIWKLPVGPELDLILEGSVNGVLTWEAIKAFILEADKKKDLGTINLEYRGDDNITPKINKFFPEPGAIGVDRLTTVAAIFNEALALGSISDATLTISSNGIAVAGEVGLDSATNAILFIPNDPGFEAETTYTIRLQSPNADALQILDTNGNPYTGDHSWDFTTGSEADTPPPVVVETSPADNKIYAGRQPGISVLFSQPMNKLSITNNVSAFNITFEDGQKTVSGRIDFDDFPSNSRILTMQPNRLLEANTLYTATISTDAKDVNDTGLSAPYTWSFTTDPLVGRWNFDNNTADVVGRADGELEGGSYEDGMLNQAISFDGENDYVKIDFDYILDSFTLSAWVKTDDDLFEGEYAIILEHGRDQPYWIALYKTISPDRFALLYENKGRVVAEKTVIAKNTWYHLVGTYQDGVAKIYVNGEHENTASTTLDRSSILQQEGELRIGLSLIDLEGFKGLIDDVQIYNTALSAEEVRTLFEGAGN